MSKSLGNVLSPADVIEHFASLFSAAPSSNPDAVARDCLRYILIRSATFNEDTTFSLPLAQQIVNTELVNCLGNLLSRSVERSMPELFSSFKVTGVCDSVIKRSSDS